MKSLEANVAPALPHRNHGMCLPLVIGDEAKYIQKLGTCKALLLVMGSTEDISNVTMSKAMVCQNAIQLQEMSCIWQPCLVRFER